MPINTKLGAHVVSGPRNGYRALVDSGMALVVSVDVGGAFDEPLQYSPGTILTYRCTDFYQDVPPGMDQATPEVARSLARIYYPQLAAVWSLEPPADYYIVLNEPGGNDPAVIPNYIAFEDELAELAEADGYKLCLANLAGGTPGNLQLWRDLWLPHLVKWMRRGHAYGRHAYGGLLAEWDESDQPVPADDNVGRPFVEADILRPLVPDGVILITELGFYAGWDLPETNLAVAQLALYDSIMRKYPNIKGSAFYTLGAWTAGKNWDYMIPPIATYIEAINALPPTEPPPTSMIKRIIHLLPQEMTQAEWNQALTQGQVFENRNTVLRSLDDALALINLSDTRSDSVLFAWWLNRWSAAEQERVRNTPVYLIEKPDQPVGDPLLGLKLAPLFNIEYVVTDPFDAPRNYGNKKHEGIDLDVTTTVPDSKEKVRCPYPGVVMRVVRATGGYYNYVVVRHPRNGAYFETWYAHLDAIDVIEGQHLSEGDPIGEIGSKGNVTAEHLHFNLVNPGRGRSGYVVADVVDPRPYLTFTQTQPEYDLLQYIAGDGRAYRVRATIGGSEYWETMYTLDRGNLQFLQVKNRNWEQFFYDDQYIYRGADTSPDNERFYTLRDADLPNRSRWIKRYIKVGESFQRYPYVQFYRKSDCAPLPENSGPAPSTITFVKHFPQYAFPGGYTVADVVQLAWGDPAQPLETYFYARKFGLVGWISHTGNHSEIVELATGIEQPMQIPCLNG